MPTTDKQEYIDPSSTTMSDKKQPKKVQKQPPTDAEKIVDAREWVVFYLITSVWCVLMYFFFAIPLLAQDIAFPYPIGLALHILLLTAIMTVVYKGYTMYEDYRVLVPSKHDFFWIYVMIGFYILGTIPNWIVALFGSFTLTVVVFVKKFYHQCKQVYHDFYNLLAKKLGVEKTSDKDSK